MLRQYEYKEFFGANAAITASRPQGDIDKALTAKAVSLQHDHSRRSPAGDMQAGFLGEVDRRLAMRMTAKS
jgi:hypothetical protein